MASPRRRPGHSGLRGRTNLTPASYTILNFEVDDIDEAVDALAARGVRFKRFDGVEQDDKGVFREQGPYIAWFKDRPATCSRSFRSDR